VKLIGMIAIAAVVAMVAVVLKSEIGQYVEQREILGQLPPLRALGLVVHQLQNERGATAAHLTIPSAGTRARLEQQRKISDSVIRDAAPGDGTLVREIGAVRRAASDGGESLDAVIDAFSVPVRRLLLRFSRPDRLQNLAPELVPDLAALAHVGLAKEYGGQIRARLHGAFRLPAVDEETSYRIARLETLVREHFRQAVSEATTEVRALLEDSSLRHVLDETLAIAALTGGPARMRLAIRPESWFGLASQAIDALLHAEHAIMDIVESRIEASMDKLVQQMLIVSLAAFLAALVIIQLTTTTLRRILHSLDGLNRAVEEIVTTGNFEMRMESGSGDEFDALSAGFNDLLSSVRNVLDEKDSLARTDPLTGIANRLRFNESLTAELARRRRRPGDMVILICDIDHFKKVNDQYGHAVGDAVLKTFARTLCEGLRRTDMVARWGGEEFTILALDTPLAQAVVLAEKLRQAIEAQDFSPAGRVTASFGVAALAPADDEAALVARADGALYRAKAEGRNRIVVAD